MKYIFTLLIITTSVLIAQGRSINYEELLKQYPQLSSYSLNDATQQKTPTQSTDFYFTDYTETELLMLDSLGVLEVLLDTAETKEGPLYFGYNYFNDRDKIAIFDNIPIPTNYRLGPGDQLSISIWGATQLRSRHMINRDGDIFVDGIGQINLTGMNITAVEYLLKEKFSEVYSTIIGKNPSTFLSITLGQLKSINISFVGEVFNPGIHAIHPYSDITTALLQVGGIKNIGSLRNIQVIRDGEIITKFDFYEMVIEGNTSQNIRLINGDVVFVPIRQSFVSIEGEVLRPGIYETKKDELIKELILRAGGLTQKAQASIEIYKLLPREQRTSEDYAYRVSYINIQDTINEIASDLTRIRVLSVPEVTREVSILGQVKTPGNYAYEDSMRVLDLFKIAGGLDDKTFLESMYTKEAEVLRQIPNSVYPKRISINLNKLLEGQSEQNILLNNGDIIMVRENKGFAEYKYVTISGQVNVPGKYTIQKKEETLDDIIARAGGFATNAYVDGLQMYRDSIQVVLTGFDMFIAQGDSVYIPQAPGIVKIYGRVQREGLVQHVNGESMRYYIERAGGFSHDADKKRIVVTYANGDVRLKKNYLLSLIPVSPPILDGSTIYVYKKKTKPPFNITQFLNTTASTATSIATLYLLYQNYK